MAMPRLFAPRPGALALVRPLLLATSTTSTTATTTAATRALIRFQSSEAAAAAVEENHSHPQQQQQPQQPQQAQQVRAQQQPPQQHHQYPQFAQFQQSPPPRISQYAPGPRLQFMPANLVRPAPVENAPPQRSSLVENPGHSAWRTGFGGGGAAASDSSKFHLLGLQHTPHSGDQLSQSLMSGLSTEIDSSKRADPLPVRLKPASGKTIHCTAGMEPMRAFSALNRLVALERTSVTARMQRFHERPGLKKKRLKSQRWRKRFAVGFAATVRKVQALTKQGW